MKQKAEPNKEIYDQARKIAPFYGKDIYALDDDTEYNYTFMLTHNHNNESFYKGMKFWLQDGTFTNDQFGELCDTLRVGSAAITNHSNKLNWKRAIKSSIDFARNAEQKYNIIGIPGVELSHAPKQIDDLILSKYHHINLYGQGIEDLDKEITNYSWPKLRKILDKHDIYAIGAHPATDGAIAKEENILYSEIHNRINKEGIETYLKGLEIINGHQSQLINITTILGSKNIDVAKLGGSDSHILKNVGHAGTLVPKNMNFYDAIDKKKTIPFGGDVELKMATDWIKKVAYNNEEYLKQKITGKSSLDPEIFESLDNWNSNIIPKKKHILLLARMISPLASRVAKKIAPTIYNKKAIATNAYARKILDII